MQFNDTSGVGMIQRCEQLVGLGKTGISGDSDLLAEFTALINEGVNNLQTVVFDAQDGWDLDDFNLNNRNFIKQYNTTVDQEYVDLDIDTNGILRVNSVQVKWETNGTWYRAEPLDKGELSIPTDETTKDQHFDKTKPYYDLRGRWLYLYPTPDASVTNGLEIDFDREMDQFTTADTTQEPGFDIAFHPYPVYYASHKWLMVNKPDRPQVDRIKAELNELEARARRYYGDKQQDRHLVLTPANVNEYFNDGV